MIVIQTNVIYLCLYFYMCFILLYILSIFFFFFLNDPPPTEISPLPPPAALPISCCSISTASPTCCSCWPAWRTRVPGDRTSSGKSGATPKGRGKKEEGRRNTTRRSIFPLPDRKSTRLNSSHSQISYAVFCLKKKK